MIKIVRLVKRRKDLTLAQFKDYWLTRHAEHEKRAIASTPLKKIVASIATGEIALGATVAPFDGMVAMYFESLDAARAAYTGPATAAMREDARNFVAFDEPQPQIFADEHLIAEKPGATTGKPGQLKVIRTVYRRRDLGQAAFKDYWLARHSKLEEKVIATTPMRRIVASFALTESASAEFDGVAELYFDRIEDIRATFTGPVPAMMRRDEENFVQMDAPAVRLVAEEYLIGEKP
jgi:uncharacterized protein (TIGR02118 family)